MEKILAAVDAVTFYQWFAAFFGFLIIVFLFGMLCSTLSRIYFQTKMKYDVEALRQKLMAKYTFKQFVKKQEDSNGSKSS